jgi:ABC-type Fe3+/spermidine/putrescine transport system ATPase subunit
MLTASLTDGREEARMQTQRSDPASVMVRLNDIRKVYPGQHAAAVEGLSLDIMEGEIFSLLGPSGCGKTTTLRIVAGLETPDHGSIFFKDKPIVVTSRRLFVPPEKRQVGMVFQSYAIWPHMSVEQNVAYPLKVRRYKKSNIRDRVASVLELVGMSHLAQRSAMSLSGGQQQRVALARALVYEPSLLLLDEPFSNLDTKLREQMRIEIKLLQSKLGITVLFVTHDQVEALSLSTRLAVIHQGRVQQVGTPRDLYEQPANQIVRDFLGRSVLLKGTVISTESDLRIRIMDGERDAEFALRRTPALEEVKVGQEICLSIRPEDLQLLPMSIASFTSVSICGVVETALFEGERTEYRIRVTGQPPICVYGGRREHFVEGDKVHLGIPPDSLTAWIG